jgi:hypothetical protein
MANERPNEITEIDLGEDFGAVAINVNGKRIEIGADGGINIRSAAAPECPQDRQPSAGR